MNLPSSDIAHMKSNFTSGGMISYNDALQSLRIEPGQAMLGVQDW